MDRLQEYEFCEQGICKEMPTSFFPLCDCYKFSFILSSLRCLISVCEERHSPCSKQELAGPRGMQTAGSSTAPQKKNGKPVFSPPSGITVFLLCSHSSLFLRERLEFSSCFGLWKAGFFQGQKKIILHWTRHFSSQLPRSSRVHRRFERQGWECGWL